VSLVEHPRPRQVTEATADIVSDRVVVVVLNWNAEHDTAACLDSFLGQQGVRPEILLVDNASADGSGGRLHARYPSVGYLQTGGNLGYTGGNNRGIAWARRRGAEWVLVVNNDTVADPDCLQRLLAAAASEPRIAALAPLIVRHDDPTRICFAGGRFDRMRGVGFHDLEGAPVSAVAADLDVGGAAVWRECTFLTGCCLLLRDAALRDVGDFQEDFFAYGEDVELCLRLARAGWRIGWVPDARIAHRVPPLGAPPSPTQILLRDRNRRRMVRLHYPLRWRLAFALWFWPTRAIHLARYLLRRDWGRGRAILAGMRER
jgi:GT2 family glycosyltransferase